MLIDDRIVIEKIDDFKSCLKFCKSGAMPCQTRKSHDLTSHAITKSSKSESKFIALTEYMLSEYLSTKAKIQDVLCKVIAELSGDRSLQIDQVFV